MQGTLRAGDSLRLDPPGREVRVRSLQVFGASRDTVGGGARVAVNVPGVDVSELRRGAVLADDAFAARASLRVRFRAQPQALASLRRRTPVRAYLGAAEILGTLVFDAAPPQDGAAVDATLHLRRATAAYPGEAYVVRALSPKTLLGGGNVDAGAVAAHDSGDVEENVAPDVDAIVRALAETALAPRTAAELGARANVREERASEILAELAAHGAARRLQKPAAFVDGPAADALSARIGETLARREAESPWTLGTTSLALARELALDEQLLVRLLASDAARRAPATTRRRRIVRGSATSSARSSSASSRSIRHSRSSRHRSTTSWRSCAARRSRGWDRRSTRCSRPARW